MAYWLEALKLLLKILYRYILLILNNLALRNQQSKFNGEIRLDNNFETSNLPIAGDRHVNSAAADSFCLPITAPSADGGRIVDWAEAMEHQNITNDPAPFTKVERKRGRTSVSQRAPTAQSGNSAPA
ncbi:hypothetical protein LAZ67_X002812 [Cordylochernes scorpioides]|uniref:Uncharacterized protein n=1 Tax=Cordylochernes scorpioides TaxID=51811 RepID=A0ABY6LUQ3_9ARAC|nr:hypothetical protein LAZ67_X002812 [Cordylochernes scorpioides]